MNIDSNLKSGDQVVNESSPIPTVKPVRYALRKDGVAWLICIIAALVDILVMGDSPRFDDPNSVPFAVGAFVGAFVLIFIVGAVVATVMRGINGRRSALVGFSFGAFGVVALTAFGQYQSQQIQSQEIKASLRELVDKQRTTIATAASSVPIDSSKSGATESSQVVKFFQDFFADTNKQKQDYQRAIAQLCGDGLLQPSKLDSIDKIATARDKLAQFRVLVDNNEKSCLSLLEDGAARIDMLPISAAEKATALSGYQRNAQKTRGLVEQVAADDRAFADKSAQLLDFMESRLGTFRVVANTPYFNSEADVSKYNAFLAQIGELVANEQQLSQQGQQLAQQSLDEMEQFCNTQ